MSRLSVVLPLFAPTLFLRALAEFSIRTMRLHADDPSYELIVAEAGGDHFARYEAHNLIVQPETAIDRYLGFPQPIGGIRETNAAIDAASGEFIVSTGSDVIVPKGWDTELLHVFEERPKDCGIASLSAFEPGATIGPREKLDMIVEGMFSPFNMFRKGWRLDEAYKRIYQDSDLVMRMYEQGLRAYRSCRLHVHHLGQMTTAVIGPSVGHDLALAQDERLFYRRWGKSPLAMFAMIRSGQYTYGNEHASWTKSIRLHYNENTPE